MHMLTDSLSVAMETSSSSGCLQEGQGQGKETALPTVHAAPHFALGPLLFLCAGEPQGLGWGPSCGGRPCWRSLPFSDFCLNPLSGSCLVQPSWLPERNWSSCLRLPLASGAGLPEWGGGPPAAPAGLGRDTGLLRNVAPPGGSRAWPSLPSLVLGFASQEGPPAFSPPLLYGTRTLGLRDPSGACALRSVGPGMFCCCPILGKSDSPSLCFLSKNPANNTYLAGLW